MKDKKWLGQQYDAQAGSLTLETLENATPKCKKCGTKENLGIVYKEITQFIGPYKNIGYHHDYFICDKCYG